ncbi:MAG: S8 family serine peptidase [Dehalococcoidia bacterium]|jgi:subtilisin family serine protease|nr:S8 family serine peptidase [Dehalococcoidia bacterium]
MVRAQLLPLLATALIALSVADRAPREVVSPVDRWERVEVTASAPDTAAAYLEALGAVIEVRSHDRVQAQVPSGRLMELRAARSLLRVEPRSVPMLLQLPSALTLLGVDRWQAAGFRGHGVRVAILDAGFEGHEDLLGSTLPARVAVRSFRSDGAIGAGIDHGTRAAEIVHRVAPEAELHLVNFNTVTELSDAVDYIVEEAVDVVSFSLGFIHNGPGDGTGAVDEIVTRGMEGGAVWSVAAGNWARQHWSGMFTDSDKDSVHEFSPGMRQNSRQFEAGDLMIVSLRWDDVWGAACSDYDLELFDPGGSLVRASRQLQDCTGDPVEGLRVLATESGRYGVRVIKASDDEPRLIDLMLVGSPGRGSPLDVYVGEGSLSEPADHPRVVTVGAVSPLNPSSVASFSSRGPTVDGRSKPEVVSPTGLVDALEDGESFAGTSAAAPHVAGLAALLTEAMVGAGPAVIRAQVTGRAVDRVAPADDESAPPLFASLGSLAGLGLLLPVAADEAKMSGELPPGAGLAALAYSGPDGYPLRFAHLLTPGREPRAWFHFVIEGQRWVSFIPGAPAAFNDLESIVDGSVVFGWFAATAPPDDRATGPANAALGKP